MSMTTYTNPSYTNDVIRENGNITLDDEVPPVYTSPAVTVTSLETDSSVGLPPEYIDIELS